MNDRSKMTYSVVAACVVAIGCLGSAHAKSSELLKWSKLPALPDKEGFAGMFAGVSNGVLIAAGGANFPDKKPWQGGEKIWYDHIYVLESPDGKWQLVEQKLPRPLAYGVSVSHSNQVICAGGGNADEHFRDVFSLSWKDGLIHITKRPLLPAPCAFMSGAKLGNSMYIAGGLEQPAATNAMHTFWSLDLSKPDAQMTWSKLAAWPGPARHHAVAGVAGDAFYLFSGIQLKPGADGKAQRIAPYLNDAYRFSTRSGTWSRLPNAPRPTAAAPGLAMQVDSKLLIMGGVDGSMLGRKQSSHPGFTREIIAFDTKTNQWTVAGSLPGRSSRVTAPAVVWDDSYLFVSGERSPGRRSPDVYRAVRK